MEAERDERRKIKVASSEGEIIVFILAISAEPVVSVS
jgi:hypothetical protein